MIASHSLSPSLPPSLSPFPPLPLPPPFLSLPPLSLCFPLPICPFPAPSLSLSHSLSPSHRISRYSSSNSTPFVFHCKCLLQCHRQCGKLNVNHLMMNKLACFSTSIVSAPIHFPYRFCTVSITRNYLFFPDPSFRTASAPHPSSPYLSYAPFILPYWPLRGWHLSAVDKRVRFPSTFGLLRSLESAYVHCIASHSIASTCIALPCIALAVLCIDRNDRLCISISMIDSVTICTIVTPSCGHWWSGDEALCWRSSVVSLPCVVL